MARYISISAQSKKGVLIMTSAAVTKTGALRFQEGHLPAPYRTPNYVREKIKLEPESGVASYEGVKYSWILD